MSSRLAWIVIPSFLAVACPLSGQTPPSPKGEQIFNSNCAACHGLDGKGGEHAPNIATDAAVQGKSDSELADIVRKGVPGAGMPSFRALLDDRKIEIVLQYLRTLQQHQAQVTAPGDPLHGRSIFFGAGGCSGCHTIDARGGFLAADLSGYGATHQPPVIRDWILHPDQNAEEEHGVVTVVTRGGQSYRGVVRNEDNFSLQIQALDGSFRLFDKSDLARVVREASSLMPNDYAKKLSSADLDDLVAFLARTKGK